MSQQTDTKHYEYIPDSSKADRWLSEDVFVYKRQRFKILPDFQVIKLRRNGEKKE